MAKISLNVDGKSHTIEADSDMPLLYALRDDLGLRNPKFGCGLAQCGACTVIIDGVASMILLGLAVGCAMLIPSQRPPVRNPQATDPSSVLR